MVSFIWINHLKGEKRAAAVFSVGAATSGQMRLVLSAVLSNDVCSKQPLFK